MVEGFVGCGQCSLGRRAWVNFKILPYSRQATASLPVVCACFRAGTDVGRNNMGMNGENEYGRGKWGFHYFATQLVLADIGL